MSCRGICTRMAIRRARPYKEGLKYCSTCEVYLAVQDLKCTCCNKRLRTNPVNKNERRPALPVVAYQVSYH